MLVIYFYDCVCPLGVCEACAGPSGWEGSGPGWDWAQCAGGQQCPLSLRVHVSGPALPLHALHHWGAVAEAPAIQTQSCSPGQPVSAALPPHLSTSRTTTVMRPHHHTTTSNEDICISVLPIKWVRPHTLQLCAWTLFVLLLKFGAVLSIICCYEWVFDGVFLLKA